MRTKVISKDERDENLKVWNAGFQVGRKIVIVSEPRKARKSGFLYGTIHRIVEPPKKYLNTGMSVFVRDKNDNLVNLQFHHYRPLPKGSKMTTGVYQQNYKPIENKIAYVPTVMPKNTPVPVSDHAETHPKRVRAKEIEKSSVFGKRLRTR